MRSRRVAHRYSPVGRCIYCGATSGQFSDEHIIPFALNGALILPKASCDACARITHVYERTVARGIFGHFRMRYKVQSRRPEKRPTHIPIGTLLPDGTKGTANVPVDEHPVTLFVYKFEQPTILRGLAPDVEDFKWVPISVFSRAELDAFIEKYHWDRLLKLVPVPVEFARTLAKIGFSFAVAEFGLDSFTPLPMTLAAILGRTSNVSFVVGGDWEIPPPDPKGMHILTPTCHTKPGGALVVIEIRLFPAFETPQYRVVVGEIDFQNPQHLKTLNEKMRPATLQDSPD